MIKIFIHMRFFKRFLALPFFFAPFVQGLGSEDPFSIDHATLGIYMENELGEVLLDRNSDLSLTPSSCMKVVTTAAALQILGADYRFATHLEYDGSIDEHKTLHGNVYIRGGGDPCLGSDRIPGSPSWKRQIEIWVEAMQKLGIRRIEGKVIGDASKWEKALAVPSWAAEDIGNYYGAGASALSFHENSYALLFKPGKKVGDLATILRTDPPLSSIHFQNEVKTGPVGSGDRASIYGSEYSYFPFVRGTVPAGVEEFAIKGAIPDPAVAAAALFSFHLIASGIAIGENEIGESDRTLFHTDYSPTLGEIVHWTNRESINLFAEHLLKEMGWKMRRDGSTNAGIEVVADFWKRKKIDLGGFAMFDGSGLSRKNLVTPKQLVRILLQMKQSPHFPIFFESLPFTAEGVRAKSGFMNANRGYAGYTESGAFAILVNHASDRKILNEKLQLALTQLSHLQK